MENKQFFPLLFCRGKNLQRRAGVGTWGWKLARNDGAGLEHGKAQCRVFDLLSSWGAHAGFGGVSTSEGSGAALGQLPVMEREPGVPQQGAAPRSEQLVPSLQEG